MTLACPTTSDHERGRYCSVSIASASRMEPRRDRQPREALAIRPATRAVASGSSELKGLASASGARSEKERASTLHDVHYRKQGRNRVERDWKEHRSKSSPRRKAKRARPVTTVFQKMN